MSVSTLRPSPVRLLILPICGTVLALGAGPLRAQTEPYHDYDPPQANIQTYAQRLVADVALNHPELHLLSLHVAPPGRPAALVVASSDPYEIGRKSGKAEAGAMASGKADVALDLKRPDTDVVLPLADDQGNPVGAVSVQVRLTFTQDPDAALRAATAVRDELSGRIRSKEQLFSPTLPPASDEIYAQRLISRFIVLHPELNIQNFHITPPGAPDNVQAASSNRFKIGKKSDPPDVDVMMTGKPILWINPKKNVVDVGLPLQDGSGTAVGATMTEIKRVYDPDVDSGYKTAVAIRDNLRKQFDSIGRLFEKADPAPTTVQIYAQRLVERVMAEHPEFISMGVHVTPPGSSINFIVAATDRSKLGRRTGRDDTGVLNTGKPLIELDQKMQDNDVGVQLLDAKGAVVGVVVMKVRLSFTRDPDAALRDVTAVRDGLKERILGLPQLFEEVTAPPPVETVGQRVVSRVAALHPELALLSLRAGTPGATMVVASSDRSELGRASGDGALPQPGAGPAVETDAARRVIRVGLPLQDASGGEAGAAVMEVRTEFAKDAATALSQANRIRDELVRQIPAAGRLLDEASPSPAGISPGQRLIDRMVARHPEVDAIGVHAAPAGGPLGVVAHSDRTEVGRKSDPGEAALAKPGAQPTVEVLKGRGLIDVGLPLEDASGRVAGAVVIRMRAAFTSDPKAATEQAERIRDELKAGIPSAGALVARDAPP